MAVYAIGDLQGCFKEFQVLLDQLQFNPDADRLWLTGDLVNRGPDSLNVLRLVKSLGKAALCVLGNHDLHLLGRAAGIRGASNRDTLDEVLHAPDSDQLLDWLRQQPLLQHDEVLGWTMVHAGLAPQWDLAMARACAREVQDGLKGDDYPRFLESLFGNGADRWNPDLDAEERCRFTVNCLTRLRYCHADGRIALGYSGAPGSQPKGQLPWFEVPGRRHEGTRVIFGHWSTLGLRAQPGLLALDGGCVWGNCLAAARIDSAPPQLVMLPCAGYQKPARNAG